MADTAPKAPNGLFDRMTGRSTEDFVPESDLSALERSERVLRADEEAKRAATISDAPAEPDVLMGSREDVIRAKRMLKASARYHATLIPEPDLQAALDRGELSPEQAAAVRANRPDRSKNRSRKRKGE